MIDASSKTARTIPVAAVFVAAACTMFMNAKFGYSLGSDETEKWVYVAFGIAMDVCKLFGLAFIYAAWTKKYRFKAMCAATVWLGVVAYSFFAATGFAAMTRSAVTAERTQNVDNNKILKDTYTRLSNELEKMKTNKRYESTAACTSPWDRMLPESKSFCITFMDTKKELATAQNVLPKAVAHDADPQMTFFSKVFGTDQEKMVTIWAFGLAILAELVSSLGTFAFSSSRAKPVYAAKSQEGQAKAVKKKGRPLGSKNKPKEAPVLLDREAA